MSPCHQYSFTVVPNNGNTYWQAATRWHCTNDTRWHHHIQRPDILSMIRTLYEKLSWSVESPPCIMKGTVCLLRSTTTTSTSRSISCTDSPVRQIILKWETMKSISIQCRLCGSHCDTLELGKTPSGLWGCLTATGLSALITNSFTSWSGRSALTGSFTLVH